jgi:hypothetical protein
VEPASSRLLAGLTQQLYTGRCSVTLQEGSNEYREGAGEKPRHLQKPDDWIDIEDDDVETSTPNKGLPTLRLQKHKKQAEVETLASPLIYRTGEVLKTGGRPAKKDGQAVRFQTNDPPASQTVLPYELPSTPRRT